jgi:D-xylose transport system substrate-binding protein
LFQGDLQRFEGRVFEEEHSMIVRKVALLVGVVAILAAACSSGGGSAAPSAAGSGASAAGCTVGVSWNNYQQPRWAKADEPAMKKAIEDAGGKYIRADANLKMEQQLTDIDTMIGQGAKVLIILAQDTKLILPAVAKAKAANIPVIAYDRLIEDPAALYLTFDNKKVGTLEAEAIMKAAPKGNYAVIKGNAGDPNANFLRGGMTEAGLPEKGKDTGDIKIVYEDYTTDWKTENAQKNMETALNQASNKIDAVVSENDSMAIGVVAALQKVGLAGTVPVSGQDGDEANLNNVAKGLQTVDVWKDAFALGRTAGDAAIQLCKGTALADIKAPSDLKDYVKPATTGTADFTTPGGAVVKSVVLTPVAITKDNLDVPLGQGWITKEVLCKGVDPATAPAACK